MLGFETLFQEFQESARTRSWSQDLKQKLEESFRPESNGHLKKWMEYYNSLPKIKKIEVDLEKPAISCSGSANEKQLSKLRESLEALAPWRKGPFQLFDIFIDTEWRSDLKWSRIAPHFDLRGKDILDVGCGNGYYGWRMLGVGAKRVVGLDPNLLFIMQFAALRQYFGPLPLYLLPVGDDAVPPNLRSFNTVFSMGVLYHRKSPIEHLQSLYHALTPGGDLVLETLVIEGGEQELLLPTDRYAQMRNVWFLPSLGLLQRMLSKCGFTQIQLVDLTQTTTKEQRATDWMRYQSLEDFLDPDNPNLTVEGYPAPLRATFIAQRK